MWLYLDLFSLRQWLIDLLKVVVDHKYVILLLLLLKSRPLFFGNTLLFGSIVNILVEVALLLVDDFEDTVKVFDDFVHKLRFEHLSKWLELLFLLLTQQFLLNLLLKQGAQIALVFLDPLLVVQVELESAFDMLYLIYVVYWDPVVDLVVLLRRHLQEELLLFLGVSEEREQNFVVRLDATEGGRTALESGYKARVEHGLSDQLVLQLRYHFCQTLIFLTSSHHTGSERLNCFILALDNVLKRADFVVLCSVSTLGLVKFGFDVKTPVLLQQCLLVELGYLRVSFFKLLP